MALVDSLVKDGWLKTPEIIKAFRKTKREDFLPARIGYAEGVAGGPEDMKNLSELNEALPIGFGQTISQPLTVAFMLELLQPKSGDKILDVGAGSGWTSALLAFIACPPKPEGRRRVRQHSNILENVGISRMDGKVIAVETVPELYEFGKNNVAKYNFIEKGIVEFFCADGSKGFLTAGRQVKNKEIYDKILVSAASSSGVPKELKKQLKIGGRLVIPVKNSIWLIVKEDDNKFQEKEFPGFVFVPLVDSGKKN